MKLIQKRFHGHRARALFSAVAFAVIRINGIGPMFCHMCKYFCELRYLNSPRKLKLL